MNPDTYCIDKKEFQAFVKEQIAIDAYISQLEENPCWDKTQKPNL